MKNNLPPRECLISLEKDTEAAKPLVNDFGKEGRKYLFVGGKLNSSA